MKPRGSFNYKAFVRKFLLCLGFNAADLSFGRMGFISGSSSVSISTLSLSSLPASSSSYSSSSSSWGGSLLPILWEHQKMKKCIGNSESHFYFQSMVILLQNKTLFSIMQEKVVVKRYLEPLLLLIIFRFSFQRKVRPKFCSDK